jgi:hypothetical protein
MYCHVRLLLLTGSRDATAGQYKIKLEELAEGVENVNSQTYQPG